jgi:hypothetical protein
MNATASTTDRAASLGTTAELADSLGSSAPDSGVLQAARRLERLAKHVESSLAEQFRQLDELLTQTPPPPRAEEVQDGARSEFAQKRTAWERERSEEFHRIEQERAQLSESWARVEAEQRRLLAEEALLRAQSNANRESRTRRSQDARAENADQAAGSEAEQDSKQAAAAAARESAMRQTVLVEYEQLKSDVQKHARRMRRAR